uniref:Putative helicase n=1 Tax=viral metagenome TaxID=1070528 RepID=A0A6M3XLN3_9ZZZZ
MEMIKNMNKLEVENNFPFTEYRKYQKEILGRCVDSINSGQKVIILEAPVGFGKSAINIGLAKSVKDAYIVTTQKILQDQYQRDFINEEVVTGDKRVELSVIKGRSNYPCKLAGLDFTCEDAICQVERDFVCQFKVECEYERAKETAANSKIAIMNTAYAFNCSRNTFAEREMLVIDEAHNLDTLGLDYISLTVNLKLFGNIIPVFNSATEYAAYLIELEDSIREYMCSQLDKFKKTKDKVYMKNYMRVGRLLKRIFWFYKDVQDNEWIFERGEEKIKFQPITVGRFLRNLIWDLGKTYIISSATIIDAEMFIREVGLDFCSGKISWVIVPMTFNKKIRPIYSIPCGKMSLAHKDKTIPKLANYISLLLSSFDKEYSVIVHSNSYENAVAIGNLIKTDRKMIIQNQDERDENLGEFMESKGSVFLSVKMTEGVDLAYDKARINIIAKVPYGFLGDKRIKKRLESQNGERWYRWKAVMELSQAYGRCIRAPDDWAKTYILDSDFGYLFHTSKKLFPEWLLEAIIWEEKITEGRKVPVEPIKEILKSLTYIYGDATYEEIMRSVRETGKDFTEDEVNKSLACLAEDGKAWYTNKKRWKYLDE